METNPTWRKQADLVETQFHHIEGKLDVIEQRLREVEKALHLLERLAASDESFREQARVTAQ